MTGAPPSDPLKDRSDAITDVLDAARELDGRWAPGLSTSTLDDAYRKLIAAIAVLVQQRRLDLATAPREEGNGVDDED